MSNREREIVGRVTRHVHRNVDRAICSSDIARDACLSESHLRKIFRRALGISLGEFVRRTTMHGACALLHASKLNITEIPYECGFSSGYTFSRAFSKKLGLSPAEYRQRVWSAGPGRKAMAKGRKDVSPR